jgi:hypothetical protein
MAARSLTQTREVVETRRGDTAGVRDHRAEHPSYGPGR